jgi:hypothetical protein
MVAAVEDWGLVAAAAAAGILQALYIYFQYGFAEC